MNSRLRLSSGVYTHVTRGRIITISICPGSLRIYLICIRLLPVADFRLFSYVRHDLSPRG